VNARLNHWESHSGHPTTYHLAGMSRMKLLPWPQADAESRRPILPLAKEANARARWDESANQAAPLELFDASNRRLSVLCHHPSPTRGRNPVGFSGHVIHGTASCRTCWAPDENTSSWRSWCRKMNRLWARSSTPASIPVRVVSRACTLPYPRRRGSPVSGF
jgi:hypothetical protein